MKKTAPLIWIFRKIKKRVPALIGMTVSYVLNALLIVAFSLGTSQVIDSAVAGNWNAFYRACILQAAIIAGILLTLALNRHLHEKLLAQLDRDWKNMLMHGLLHGDYAQVSTFHSGELLNRLNNDVRTLDTALLTTLPNAASMITKIGAALAVLIALEPIFSLLLIAGGLLVVVTTGLMRRKLKQLHKQVSESDGKVLSFLQETLEKLLMVQAMDVSDEMERRSDRLMHSRYIMQRKRKNMSLLANSCVSFMAYGANFVALVWCSVGLLHGSITFGTLTAVLQLVGQLQQPIVSLSGIIPQYISMLAAAERLMELEAVSGQPVQRREDRDSLYESMTAIGGENLCFAYDRDPVFAGTSFRVPKGEFGVITGQSGIGKSTLLKLLLGIFHPEQGALFAETPTQQVSLDRSTRGLFAYVPQGNLLISGTLRENLTITRPEATESEIQQAIYISAMDDFLPSLPQGLDTVLGESGAGLSEGQAQRLSIARAILSQAPVLLLDEATSALDEDTETRVLQRIKEAGKTCIAVTHRPAAVAISDWCLHIQDGKSTLTHK